MGVTNFMIVAAKFEDDSEFSIFLSSTSQFYSKASDRLLNNLAIKDMSSSMLSYNRPLI